MTFGDGCESMNFGNACSDNILGDTCNRVNIVDNCQNLTLPNNGTYGTINILGSITGGVSGMDLADNDHTLFQTWLGAGNNSNTIEIRQIISSGAESTWKYIAQYIDDHGVLQTKTKTGTAGTWA